LQVLMVLVMTWLRFECVLGAGRRELCKRLRRARAWRSWHAWQSRRSEARLHRLASQLAACRAQAHREAEQVVAVHRRVAAEWYELVVQARPEQQESLLSRLDERWAALLAAQQPGLPSAGFVTEGQPRSFNTPHPPVARLARRPLFTHAPSEA
jgi:hypothetical protein